MISNILEKVHWVRINVRKNCETVESLSWQSLSFDLRMKYDWYFKYRAALLQVKYPRLKVEFTFGSEAPKEEDLKRILEKKIRSKKAKITKYENKLKRAEETWNSLFPIEEDEIYLRAKTKIVILECELRNMIEESNNL